MKDTFSAMLLSFSCTSTTSRIPSRPPTASLRGGKTSATPSVTSSTRLKTARPVIPAAVDLTLGLGSAGLLVELRASNSEVPASQWTSECSSSESACGRTAREVDALRVEDEGGLRNLGSPELAGWSSPELRASDPGVPAGRRVSECSSSECACGPTSCEVNFPRIEDRLRDLGICREGEGYPSAVEAGLAGLGACAGVEG
ncbi:uncharacterized protein C8Q71DRAFT_767166 [Rhodofomes roseus]|uniref:Uncharacterized protein n=1 Tax=Rhodofomes roseus TaxID=34475 RepID=A0ABQ8KBH6_9APHY|nr:uncharacterized protein C8Q71DRAFT_767166 [Rhodofomes roseus]KAH9834900.1 hypothetical protein C8Q71DRAFT_767166 [Rhodofomes roseus]